MTKLKDYEIFRSYVVHEDKLIGERNTWFLVSQSFLFLPLGLTLSATSREEVDPVVLETGQLVLGFIPFLGLILSISTFISVLAAILALGHLERVWDEKCVKLRNTAQDEQAPENRLNRIGFAYKLGDSESYYPLLTGGGSRLARTLGLVSPFVLSLVFAAYAPFPPH